MKFIRQFSITLMATILMAGITTPSFAAPIDDARAIAQFVFSGLKDGLGGLSPRERARLFSESIINRLKEEGLTISLEDIAQVIYDEGKSVGITPRLAVQTTLESAEGDFSGIIRIIHEGGETIEFTATTDVITSVEDPTSP